MVSMPTHQVNDVVLDGRGAALLCEGVCVEDEETHRDLALDAVRNANHSTFGNLRDVSECEVSVSV